MRGAKPLRIALTHAQRAAMRNGHKPPWLGTPREERITKAIEEFFECIDSVEDEEATDEEKLMELGDAMWTLVQLYDNEGLLTGEED
jgi:NTP pyrophosphatase (non-canonical NTP hydrolase)